MRFEGSRRAVAGLLLAVMLAGCGGRSDDAAEPAVDAQVPVRVARVETRAFEDALEVPGQWRSSGERIVAAPFDGVVDTLLVQVGDAVRSGQRVAAFATLESRAALQGAELLAREATDDAARAEARRALELARRDLVRVPLVAPADGVVVRRSAEPETRLAGGAEVLAIAPADRIVFEAHVAALAASRVRTGERAEIREEGAQARAAVVQRTLPGSDPADQTTLVWLSPAAGGAAPRIGHFGTATIVVGASRRGAGVPDAAVVEDDLTGQSRVAVVDSSGRARWIDVELGAVSTGWRELRSPALATGTRVVIEGQRGLPDSTRVSVAGESR